MAAAIVIENLIKRYGATAAVDGVGLEVAEGEVFCLLGPNGAGKTTLIEILEGHRRRTSGEVHVLGFDPETGGRDFRERIGIMLQNGSLENELTGREAVEIYGSLYPNPRPVNDVIKAVGLTEKSGARIKTLSGGQKRRLELALAIVGEPDLIFPDEPTTGFDPSARRQAWELVAGLRGLGKTILLTTHYMDEAQNLADRIAVIARGQIVAEGTPKTLGDRDRLPSHIRFRVAERAQSDLPAMAQAAIKNRDGEFAIRTAEPTQAVHDLTAWALGQGVALEGLTVAPPSLEDIYLNLIGHEAADD